MSTNAELMEAHLSRNEDYSDNEDEDEDGEKEVSIVKLLLQF